MIPPIAAEPIAYLGSFPITNALVNAWIAVVFFVVACWFLKRRITAGLPGKFQNFAEAVVEFFLGYVDQVTHDRARSKRFLPLVGSFFIFILFSNWLGQLPGTGSITVTALVHGSIEKVPLLRPAASDLNLTLAMALLSVIVSHLLGIITIGFFKHWNRFFAVGNIINGFKKGGINIMVGLIEAMVGLIEFSAEIAKVLSLSLRLFGNIFAGEVLITVLYSLVAFILPLPFMGLELIVGVVQAMVFAMLSLVYLTILTEKPHGSEAEHKQDEIGEAHGTGHLHDRHPSLA
jgi:F-type H+-transporting ATPase subunit a